MNKTEGACNLHPDGCPDGGHLPSNEVIAELHSLRVALDYVNNPNRAATCQKAIAHIERLRAALQRLEQRLRGYAEFSPADELHRIVIEALSGDSSAPETTAYTEEAQDIRESAQRDLAYFDGARQAQAIAHQSLVTLDKWIQEGCGNRWTEVKRVLAGLTQETKPEPGPMCAVCDHLEELHPVMGASHPFRPKATETPEQRRATIEANALADAHRMYEAEHGEPFTENGKGDGT